MIWSIAAVVLAVVVGALGALWLRKNRPSSSDVEAELEAFKARERARLERDLARIRAEAEDLHKDKPTEADARAAIEAAERLLRGDP